MRLYPIRTNDGGVFIGMVTLSGFKAAMEFPDWQTFEDFFQDLSAWHEEEIERMARGIPDEFLKSFESN